MKKALAVLGRLERVRPLYILPALVLAQWIAVLDLARTVVHNGWIYYQGGDQLWYYSTAWLLVHGQMPQALVGDGAAGRLRNGGDGHFARGAAARIGRLACPG